MRDPCTAATRSEELAAAVEGIDTQPLPAIAVVDPLALAPLACWVNPAAVVALTSEPMILQ